MSSNQVSHNYPDTVNSFTLVGEFGFDHYDGPFEWVIEGGKYGIVVPKDSMEDYHLSALKRYTDTPALVMADGEPVVGGHVNEVVEIEGHDELHVVGDSYPMGDA